MEQQDGDDRKTIKSRSKTFKPGDEWDEILDFIDSETNDAIDVREVWGHTPYTEYRVSKRLTITIAYERDDKSTGT